jgi:thiol-disulfide isomerase/thioredoxin
MTTREAVHAIVGAGVLMLWEGLAGGARAQNPPAPVMPPPPAIVSGVIVDSAGVPIPHAVLSVVGESLRVMTDSEGRFHLAVPPGPRLLAARALGYRPLMWTVALESGEDASGRIGLQKLARSADPAQFGPTALRMGAQIPEFTFAALDDSTVTYTRESLTGKMYLLEFWATWCGPCVAEMKYLQAAHDSLAPQGLEILSVSLDMNPEDVRRFRHGPWKMPWLNALVPGSLEHRADWGMEISYIPRAVLVGKDGRILAVDEELSGDRLIPTIRRALQTASSP